MSAVSEPRTAPSSVHRTGALVLTSVGALLLAAAATVFTVIAWEQLRLPGKVAIVGAISIGALTLGHVLRHRLPGVAAVVTHLGAALAPLVAGAGAVVFSGGRSTAAIVGGVVGVAVLWLADRFDSPLLAGGRAFALAGIAVGAGAVLGVPASLIVLALAAAAVVLSLWDEAMVLAVLAACGPLLRWSTIFADDGSLLFWLADVSDLSAPWAASIAVGSTVVLGSVITLLPAGQLIRTRSAAVLAGVVAAINIAEVIETALTTPALLAAALTTVSAAAYAGTSVRRGYAGATLAVTALLTASATTWLTPPVVAVLIVASAAHAIRSLEVGRAPRAAQSLLTIMLVATTTAFLAHGAFELVEWSTAWMPTAALVVASFGVSRLTNVPDLVAGPRLALLLPVWATAGDLRIAGVLAVASGVALLIDSVIDDRRWSEYLGLVLLVVGNWMLVGSWSVEALEAYAAGPAIAAAWLGWRVVERGGSSWVGLAPAVALFTSAGLLERIDGGNGWHAVGVGATAVLALAVSVAARWRGPSTIAALALTTIVVLETAAFVPAVPVWIWLGIGGVALLGGGAALESRAGTGDTVSLRAAWAAFR